MGTFEADRGPRNPRTPGSQRGGTGGCTADPMERLTRTVLRFRWAVLAIWLVLLVASSAAASGLTDLLTNRFTLPGTDTAKVEKVLQENFGQVPDGSFTVIARGWI